ncbi:GreA/GreB family elongation factor [Glycocaulis sp.]|uniref:GreA/GreB family elongation factor n=1 Tax=Glycocaulis sp. TaxID=1969725 RepID=UPI003F6E7A07
MQTLTQPAIYLDEDTADTLYDIASAAPEGSRATATRLLGELERAIIVPSGELPDKVVRLGVNIAYRDTDTGRVRTGSIVLPQQADISAGRISVLSPAGAGLIGLEEGSAISWRIGGRETSLLVLKVG